MIETLAAHKVAVLAGLLGAAVLAWYLHSRHVQAAAAAVPVDPYSSTPPSSNLDPGGSLSVPAQGPSFNAGGAPPPTAASAGGSVSGASGAGPNTTTQTSTGPGAGPTLAAPVTDPNLPVPQAPAGAPLYLIPTAPGSDTFLPTVLSHPQDYTSGNRVLSSTGMALAVPESPNYAALNTPPGSNVHRPGFQA